MTQKKRTHPRAPELCPVCNEEVPSGALACPECGADHKSGWRENSDAYDGLNIPDNDFNYDDFVKREFGPRVRRLPELKMVWLIAGIVLIVAVLLMYFYAAH
jgi:ssDNA-binding Zn-finger/Zn-ribbon topoisomerase 1